VPISVVMPPSNEANARGMRRSEGEFPLLCARRIATGIINARAPTLFINPEHTLATVVSAATCTVGRSPRPCHPLGNNIDHAGVLQASADD
jgi:hypothetical protein